MRGWVNSIDCNEDGARAILLLGASGEAGGDAAGNYSPDSKGEIAEGQGKARLVHKTVGLAGGYKYWRCIRADELLRLTTHCHETAR